MKPAHLLPCLLIVLMVPTKPARGDGCYFPRIEDVGTAAELAQSRQEVLLAFHSVTLLSGSDICDSAVAVGPDVVYQGSTVDATNDAAISCGSSETSPDVWYRYTPMANGVLTISLYGLSCDAVLSVHSGCPGTTNNLLACSEDVAAGSGPIDSQVTLSVTAAATYYLRLAGRSGAAGTYAIELDGPQASETDDGVTPTELATYVLRSGYTGSASEFAWVVPVPATPADVVAHLSGSLFDQLNDLTQPRFLITSPYRGGGGCGGCGLSAELGGGGVSSANGLVTVEASGEAGIFSWAALTSSGSSALLTWLNDNGFAVPATANDIVDQYIQQDMHFLAVRITEPDALTGGEDGQIEIPPIQFTCQTAQRFYPMAISRISAASETEVLIYVLADHRAESANVANGVIDSTALTYDASSPSKTNYESLFAQKITELGGTALITEYAYPYPSYYPYWDTYWYFDLDSDLVQYVDASGELDWPQAPPGALSLGFLTRMRTVLARENMTLDFQFQDASADGAVLSEFWVTAPSEVSTASLAGQPLAALLVFALFRGALRRRSRSTTLPPATS